MPISGLIQSPASYTTYFPSGEALATRGLENRGIQNGFGLVTRGLVWQMYDIWFDVDYYKSITTTWTPVQFGVWGEYSP